MRCGDAGWRAEGDDGGRGSFAAPSFSRGSATEKEAEMREHGPILKTLEEIERDCFPGLLEVLRTKGIEGVRYALFDMTGWHRDYDPCLWRRRATEKQKRVGWEMWVRMEKIIATLLHEAHELQVEEARDVFEEGPESFYKSSPDRQRLPGGVCEFHELM